MFVVKGLTSELETDSAFMPTLSLILEPTLSRLGRLEQVHLVSIHTDFTLIPAHSQLFEDASKALWTDFTKMIAQLPHVRELKCVFKSLQVLEDFVVRHFAVITEIPRVTSNLKMYYQIVNDESMRERWVDPHKIYIKKRLVHSWHS